MALILKRSISKRSKIIAGSLAALVLIALLIPIPDPLFDKPCATVLESSNGQLLGARIATDGQWRFPPADSLPGNYRTGLLMFEDRHFYQHFGINPVSIVRAVRQNMKAGRIVSGGSTITMQVARMAMGNQPRTIVQKLVEMWLAIRIELRYSKEEVLHLYANNAPFGGNVVGLSAAAWRYYSRSMHQLSWAEVANMVILPNAPGLMFPGTNDELLVEKRNRLLEMLKDQEVIDEMTYKLSIAEPLAKKPQPLPNLAMHLLDRSMREGYEEQRVRSTLDHRLQSAVKEIVNAYYENLRFKEIHNAAALVASVRTGEALAYIGNVGLEQTADHGQEVDIITSRRSPGSLLKPFLYGMSIDDGIIAPDELLPDIPVYYQGFAPRNFDKQFRGAVPANLALRSSLNVPFVSLLRDYTYEKFHYQLGRMGIKSLNRPSGHYGLSIILGGGDVTLWEMAGLYAGLARNLQTYNTLKGQNRYDIFAFRPLTYHQNEPISSERTSDYIISAGATWHTLKTMQLLRRPDAESNWQQFTNSQSIAWKTGTSYGHKDAWAIGLNDDYVVAVWIGNADGEGRPDLTGVVAAAPLMFRIFEVLDGEARFPIPVADMETMTMCKQSGQKATGVCPETETVPIARNALKTASCSYHKEIHLDEKQQYQVNSICYPIQKMVTTPWFILPPSQAWFYKKFNSDFALPPQYRDDCAPQAKGTMEMIYPRNFTKVFVPVEIDGALGKVVFEAAHQNPETKIFWYLDDQFVGETRQLHQLGLFPSAGPHLLSLVDEQGRELSVPFEAINDRKF
jgi:penicillin-binding protein 1C